MKNHLRLMLAALFISSMLFSCTTAYNELESNTISDVLTKANWSVNFISNDPLIRNDFSGNTLSFDGGGAAMLNRNDTRLLGKWNTNGEIILLNINDSDPSVTQINKAWKVLSKNTTSVTFSCEDPQLDCKMILTKK